MLFNSLEYLIFLPLIGLLYFLLPHKQRWVLLLLASYLFYAFWKVEYAVLILISTAIDYWAGLKMAQCETKQLKKKFLWLSLLGNLGMLFGFKYLGFFNELLRDLSGTLDISYDVPVFNILLPIGISFYTFQSLSYTIDVYRGHKLPEKHFGIFALYVSFFPQLVAGPIERSTTLLPQLRKKQVLDPHKIIAGCKLIFWGLFKKIVIADTIAIYVNQAYADPNQFQGLAWMVFAAAFSVQLYMDFSAYSDIAIGSARVFGIELTTNFDRPFKTVNVREFWNKWHISLSNWLFDYVYKPLRKNKRMSLQVSILIFFIVTGIWHGAGVNFIIFGLIHGFFYILSKMWSDARRKKKKGVGKKPLPLRWLGWIWVFSLLSFSGIFFRAETVADSWFVTKQLGTGMLSGICSFGEITMAGHHIIALVAGLGIVGVLHHAPSFDPKTPFAGIKNKAMRWGLYYALLFMLLIFGHSGAETFVYFQF
jgi:alginate O-acetyltransferase complex protein AlgI